jgi:glycosyltransferase involved in cell wall biosynthesis
MPVYGVTMVKDEADVIAGTLRHMASEVDGLVVADNGSTDGTRELIAQLAAELPLPVIIVDDTEPAYYQSRKMSNLAAAAADAGGPGTWVVPFDADEIWYAAHPLREVLPSLWEPVAVAQLFNHFRTALDADDPDPYRSMVWRQAQPAALGKVAFQWRPGAVIHQGNHGVSLPGYAGPGIAAVELRHFPYRSAEQFVRKAVNGATAYKLTDLPDDQGAHWRAYGETYDRHGEQAVRAVFEAHFNHLSPVDVGMVRDPAPYLRWAAQ